MSILTKNGHRLLFVHVPKTGGSWVQKVFTRQGWRVDLFDDSSGRQSLNDVWLCPPQHFHIEPLRMMLDFRRFSQVFTVIRNPVNRIWSEYWYQAKGGLYGGLASRPFDDWLPLAINQYRDNPFAFNNHLRPQGEFVGDEVTVFRYEDGLDQIVETFLTQRAMRWGRPGNVRDSGSQLHRPTMSSSSRGLIETLYEGDFVEFNYSWPGTASDAST